MKFVYVIAFLLLVGGAATLSSRFQQWRSGSPSPIVTIKSDEELANEKSLERYKKLGVTVKRVSELAVGEAGYMSISNVIHLKGDSTMGVDTYRVRRSAHVFPKREAREGQVRIVRKDNTVVVFIYASTNMIRVGIDEADLSDTEKLTPIKYDYDPMRMLVEDLFDDTKGYISASDMAVRKTKQDDRTIVEYYVAKNVYTSERPEYEENLLLSYRDELMVSIPEDVTIRPLDPNANLSDYVKVTNYPQQSSR